MDIHQNARTTPESRALIVKRVSSGESVRSIAMGMGVCTKTIRKWLQRFADEGAAGLRDRSSRPHRLRVPTPAQVAARAVELRRERQRMWQIACELGVSKATVSRLLKRAGLSRLSALTPAPALQRYEYAAAGELLHLDTKRLGRFRRVGARFTGSHQKRSPGAGFEVTHVCIDDHSRLAYAEVLRDERQATTCGFLGRALEHFASLGIRVARVMTDNGSAYRSATFARALARRGIRHLFTRPYTPRTNGKAERFIQTALREWAYACPYPDSTARAAQLPTWLHRYNCHRPHLGIGALPPISRLPPDNLLQLNS